MQLTAAAIAGAGRVSAATCVSGLDPETAAQYNTYLDRVRPQMERPLEPGYFKNVTPGGEPHVWNLNAPGPNGVQEVGKGVIIHWAGAIRIRIPNVDKLEQSLLRYDRYTRWYAPYIFESRATRASDKQYRVTTVLHDIVEKPSLFLPDMHFSFEVESLASFRRLGNTLLVTNHADKIRESDSGDPKRADSRNPRNDLMREEYGHGVLWRSDTQWRAISAGDSVYAEYESIALARSVDAITFTSPCAVLRLPGIRNKALQAMTERPKKLVTNVLMQTRQACESSGA
jgi:hypothetical protein